MGKLSKVILFFDLSTKDMTFSVHAILVSVKTNFHEPIVIKCLIAFRQSSKLDVLNKFPLLMVENISHFTPIITLLYLG